MAEAGLQKTEGTSKTSIQTTAGSSSFPELRNLGILDPTLIYSFSKSRLLIGGFSEDENKKFLNDSSSLKSFDTKYYPETGSTKQLQLNLAVTHEQRQDYTLPPKRALENILKWIIENRDTIQEHFPLPRAYYEHCCLNCNDYRLMVDFLSTEDVLMKILEASYNPEAKLSFYAQNYNHTIYLMNDEEKLNETSRNWEQKFKQYVTGQDVEMGSMISNEKYNSMIKATLGPFKLLYSVSPDCVDTNVLQPDNDDLSAHLFLRCASDKYNQNNGSSKMINWYYECLLSTVPKTYVAYTDNSGTTNSLKLYTEQELFDQSLDFYDTSFYDTSIGMKFLLGILQFIKERTKEYPKAVLHFTKKGKDNVLNFTQIDDVSLIPDFYKMYKKSKLQQV